MSTSFHASAEIPARPSTSVVLDQQVPGPILQQLLEDTSPIWQFRVASFIGIHPPIRMHVLELDTSHQNVKQPTRYVNIPNVRGEDMLDLQRWVIEAGWVLGAPSVRREFLDGQIGLGYCDTVTDMWNHGLRQRGVGPDASQWIQRVLRAGFYRWDVSPLATLRRIISPGELQLRRDTDPTLGERGFRRLPVPRNLVMPALVVSPAVLCFAGPHLAKL